MTHPTYDPRAVGLARTFHWEVYVPMNCKLYELVADCLEGSHRYQGQAQVEEVGYYIERNQTYLIGVSQPARFYASNN